ncbi:hypothetical protein B0O80DRAFT_517897 [Mortierella sp. GBAus27b]|nr:hypothetical protein B0O80DRAFT_517897 [Mortierella sp. GBAus27b]
MLTMLGRRLMDLLFLSFLTEMPSLSRTRTFFIAFFALCFGITLCPSIHAQIAAPNAFVDGQRHYIFGGFNGTARNADPVMIDLTVSWNTSSPAVEKLPNSDAATFAGSATLLPSGNIFILSYGNGYIYNVRTSSWTINITNLPMGYWDVAVADMETGLIYVPNAGVTRATYGEMLEVDLKTKTITKTKPKPGPSPVRLELGAWSAPLRSLLFIEKNTNMLYTYTPSKVNGTSDGWGTMETTGDPLPTKMFYIACFVPAHNGSTMVLMVGDEQHRMTVYVLDVETRTWKSGPLYSVPIDYATYSCSVSGDQLISYGPVSKDGTASQNSVSVYNMKTEEWVTTYTAPPPQPDTNTDNTGDYSNKKIITIIVTVIGVLLAIILTAITAYIGATKRPRSRGQGTSSDGSSESLNFGSNVTTPGEVLAKGIFGLRNPVDAGINSIQEVPDRAAKPMLNIFGRVGRLQQGSFGALEDTGHPHAVVEESTTGRNVQEGTSGARSISQHPHTYFMDALSQHPHANLVGPISQHPHVTFMDAIPQHPHANVMDTSMYNDKEESIDSTMYVMEEPKPNTTIHNDKVE